MEEIIKKLIIRVWDDSRQMGMSCGQTRITKLMYLIEWEYFAWTRQRLTSLDWTFWHYGPWSSELSTVLEKEFKTPQEEVEEGKFRKVHWAFPECEYVDTKLAPVDLEGTVERVMETFGSLPTEEIIEYVYYNTEPMKHAIRKEPLDFETTPKPFRPFNAFGALKSNTRKEIREKLSKAVDKKVKEAKDITGAIPQGVHNLFTSIDVCEEIDLEQKRIEINDEDKLRIAREG